MAEQIVVLSRALLLRRGAEVFRAWKDKETREPREHVYLFKVIENNGCLLVEVGNGDGRRWRRFLEKFLREGGLDGFDRTGQNDLELLEEVWGGIRELSDGEAEWLETEHLGGEKKEENQVVQPIDQGTDQVQTSFIEQCGQEGDRNQNQSSRLG